MGALLEQAMGMQQQLLEAQAAAAEQVVEGQAGGGAVVVRVTGGHGLRVGHDRARRRSTPTTSTMLQDLVLAALHDAMDEVAALQQSSMGGLDLGGLGGLGELGGMLGGDAIEASTVEPGAEADDGREQLRRSGPGPDRRAGATARGGAEVGPAHRLPPAQAAQDDALRLAWAIVEVKDKVTFCPRCFNIAEGDECGICADPRRDTTVICVVEEPKDIVSVEKTGEFRGRYHVLQGAISPIEGIGPDQLRVKELLGRLDDEAVDRDHPLHQPEPRGRGHGDVPQPADQAARASRSPASPAVSRWAATSSTPTS